MESQCFFCFEGLQGPLQSPVDMTRELSENMDKVIATLKKLEYLLSRPQNISSISEAPCLIPLFVSSASHIVLAEALVWERILTTKDGQGAQFVSLPR